MCVCVRACACVCVRACVCVHVALPGVHADAGPPMDPCNSMPVNLEHCIYMCSL